MAILRLFAAAREAAGTGRATIDGSSVGEILDEAVARFGEDFAAVLETCRVWKNGDPCERADRVQPTDELAVLPPVSGG